MPLMRNLNPGNQFAVNIDWVSASYKLLYSHRDHIDQFEYVMFMEYLYIDVVEAEEAVIKQKMMAQGSEGNASRPKREI